MYKSCSKCGKIHPVNTRCKTRITPYSNNYKSDEDKLRNSYKWHKKAEEIKEAAQYLCEVCRDLGIYNYDKLEVHHITKLRNDTSLLLDNYNLICLCWKHHKLADQGQINSEYLRQLAMTREGNR